MKRRSEYKYREGETKKEKIRHSERMTHGGRKMGNKGVGKKASVTGR